MNRVRFEVVHNIPSPYRIHLFRALAARLQARGHEFLVHFMARAHEDRSHWRSEAQDLGFHHRYWRDWGPRFGGAIWHWNPGLITHLVRNPPDVVLFGGLWDSLTTSLAALTSGARIKLGWFEGVPTNPGRTDGVIGAAKRALLRRCDHLVVPGLMGAALAQRLARGDAPPVVILPNVVDETRFGSAGERESARVRVRLGIAPGARLAICPARLVPEKGLLEFFGALDRRDLKDWNVVVLGDGPLEAELKTLVRDRGLEPNVRLAGSISYGEMPSVYAAANLFLLPSVTDRNPLSVVEAVHSGLPLLISRAVGNAPEALEEGTNGWSFDIADGEQVRRAMRAAAATGIPELRAMGARSRERARRYWSTTAAVDEFLNQVLEGGR